MIVKLEKTDNELIADNLDGKVVEYVSRRTEEVRQLCKGKISNAEWTVEKVKVAVIEKVEDKEGEFKIFGLVHKSFDDSPETRESHSDKVQPWIAYADLEMIERLSKCGVDAPICVVYIRISYSYQNYLIDFMTREEYEEYEKNFSVGDEMDFYRRLVLLSNLGDEAKKYVRMRWGMENIKTHNGSIYMDDVDYNSTESRIVYELCYDLVPEYVKRELKYNEAMSRNKKLSDTLRNVIEVRNKFYTAVPFGLPIKKFDMKEGMEQVSHNIHGRVNELRKILSYLYSKRKPYFDKSIPEIYKLENNRTPAVVVICGNSGSGKELIANEIPKVVSHTYSEFHANSSSKDTSEWLGSSTIYENSKNGSISEMLKFIGDNGVVSIIGLGDAKPIFRSVISDIVTHGTLRDNNLECAIDLSRTIFIITANKKSDVPADILNMACVVNLDKMSEEERLIIGHDYMLPEICEKQFVDSSLIKFSDEILDKLCNRYVATSSLDEIYNNLQVVVQNLSNDYTEELERGEMVEPTDEYIRDSLFESSYETYAYDINKLTAKFKLYRSRFTKERQAKIEQLFEEYESTTENRDRNVLEEKLRFHVNYVPPMTEIKLSVEDIVQNYKKIMDEKEYGHNEAKDLIINSLVENVLAGNNVFGSLNLLFYGSAGTGKTMFARMIAGILGCGFIKISLNGMKDPANLKGIIKDYVGASLGKLAFELSKNCSSTTVVLLDEIEKANLDVHNALFDILDPSENGYYDNFLGDIVDTSHLIFIATANDISNIPAALMDRFNCIRVEGYTNSEKKEITRDFTIPKYINKYNLEKKISFREDAIDTIVDDYTSTSSVREIEKSVNKVITEAYKEAVIKDKKKIVVTNKLVRDVIGSKPVKPGRIPSESNLTPGVVNCLGVRNGDSGSVFQVTVKLTPHMKERSITGSCKEMIRESIERADVLVSNILDRELENTALSFTSIGIPKDGPSAGVSITIALMSAHLGICVPNTVGFTGEVDIDGSVGPIGGLEFKLEAARKVGITKVYIPEDNREEYEEMLETGRLERFDGFEVVPVTNVSQIAKELFGENYGKEYSK